MTLMCRTWHFFFVGDNVDHSILTTDGKGSFHGMGIIAALTPRWKRDSIIPRRDITNLDLPMQSKIPLIKYRFVKHMRLTRTSQNWSTGTKLFMSSGSSHWTANKRPQDGRGWSISFIKDQNIQYNPQLCSYQWLIYILVTKRAFCRPWILFVTWL